MGVKKDVKKDVINEILEIGYKLSLSLQNLALDIANSPSIEKEDILLRNSDRAMKAYNYLRKCNLELNKLEL